jgi:LysM repeat protein
MNDKFTNNTDDELIGRKLNQIAEQTHANGQFAAELEERLRNAHPPRVGWFASFVQVSPTIRWVALMILLAVVLSWSIKSLIPAPQPAFNTTPSTFVCPVTLPNGSQPYGKTGEQDPDFHGNGQLWTKLWPNGKIYMLPTDQLPDGSFSQKWYFERGVSGTLTIEGHRLDADAAPLRADIPEGYGETGLQVLSLIFPTTGCWEVTGRVSDASLTFVTEVVFGEAIPTPNVTINQNATPVSEQTGYDFRGAKLYLGQPLPESPATAHVYLLNKQDQKATLEQARALAGRFGIQGEVYTEPTYIFDTNNYVFSDGKQSLSVYSLRFFSYIADLSKTSYYSKNTPNDNAESIIREFLQARGFDFPFRVIASDFFNGYIVQPLAPDSLPMQYESFTPPSMVVMLDETGAVLRVDAYQMDFDPAPVGEYGIISAQEALEKVLDDSLPGGKTEFVHGASNWPREWHHIYPDNQPLTAYGHITIYPAAEVGKPALVLMDGVPVTGNIQGLESLDRSTLVKVTGQYMVENGIRQLSVESWDKNVTEAYVSGTLSRQGDQILLTSDDGSGQQYPLIDPPSDVPLDTKVPETQLAVSGVITDGKMFWTYIQFFEGNSGGGGGGGGGLGFYKLNLSGPAVPFPTPASKPHMGGSEYVVKEGDTVLAIAQLHGLTPERIFEANPELSGGVLSVGMTIIIPSPEAPKTETEFPPTQYVVQENDTLASIAFNFGVSVEALMQANGITENQVFTGQTLVIPNVASSEYVVQEGDTLTSIAQNFGTTVDNLILENGLPNGTIMIGQRLLIPPSATNPPQSMIEKVEDMRGYLTVTIHNQVGGISTKEYTLEVSQNGGGMILYTLDGSNLGELDTYNGLPILVSGTLGPTGKLLMESYKIPYPDLHFQILKGTQKAQQLSGQDVIIFTTEDGNSYVEFLATNNQPTGTFTDHVGEVIQQEVLIVPDETFAGMPVAHIYQSAVIQENGPELQVQADHISVFNDGSEPGSSGVYVQPNLTISKIELVYFVSNPYYQVNDPNYDQRSNDIQPVWHFHGRYDDGTEFDMLIQALKEEFLLPELVPNAGMG